MAVLSVFCPVKTFSCFVRNERHNSVATTIGSLVALVSFPSYVFLLRHGFNEWVKPTAALGFFGAATAILGLENARILAERKFASKNASKKSPHDVPKEVIDTIEYLATFYWLFWEDKVHNESEVLKERLVRSNVPSEFAYVFGYALLKSLEMKINARYEKICEREGDVHPERWEFRLELCDLDMQERELWLKVKNLTDEFRAGKKAFNKRDEDFSMSRPLIYCELLNVLRHFHPIYKKILLEARALKKSIVNQQMAEPTIKLPTIPESFNVSDREQKSESSSNVALTEIEDSSEGLEAAAGGFAVSDNEPVVSRFLHLDLADDPVIPYRPINMPFVDYQQDSQTNYEMTSSNAKSADFITDVSNAESADSIKDVTAENIAEPGANVPEGLELRIREGLLLLNKKNDG